MSAYPQRIRSLSNWRRWYAACDECPWRRWAKSRENAQHLADLHNEAGCPTPDGEAA